MIPESKIKDLLELVYEGTPFELVTGGVELTSPEGETVFLSRYLSQAEFVQNLAQAIELFKNQAYRYWLKAQAYEKGEMDKTRQLRDNGM